MEKTKITIVCENRASEKMGIMGEHGFCALIEKNNEKILLDTGQGLCLKANAHVLDINLAGIRKIVLSHGHFDHTGGLADLMPRNEKTDIWAHPDIFAPKYVRRGIEDEDKESFIGIRFSQEQLESDMNAQFHFKKEFSAISDDIFFSGEIPRLTDFEGSDTRLLVKQGQSFIPDPLLDDASLLIETASGPVILAGCAHSGIVNVMNHFSQKTGYTSFHAVIGGTHLGFLNSDQQLEKTMDAFEHYNLKLIAVSHCTGNEAASACHNRFKDRFAYANAGWSVEF